MYKLIQIINNQKIDHLILTIWNKDNIGIEASTITRHKGHFDISTYYSSSAYSSSASSTDRITFAEALRLLENDYLKPIELKESYYEKLKRIYNKKRITDEFFEKCSKNDGLLQALTINKI